jgi:hypothetical protein
LIRAIPYKKYQQQNMTQSDKEQLKELVKETLISQGVLPKIKV